FVVKSGIVRTPPLGAGILPGITRDVILERGSAVGVPMREEVLRVADLVGADEVFITSTLKEAAPVSTVDGHPVGSGKPGPITLRILRDFREYAPLHAR